MIMLRLYAFAAACWAAAQFSATAQSVAETERAETGVVQPWSGNVPEDLHREYHNIFKRGNRNAASHRWSTFLLDRSVHMSTEKFELMFSGFCAVSGSPVRPREYTRYRMTLDNVAGGTETGFTYYCCWPCVCDTEDFIKIDTKTVRTADGEKQYRWMVIGNPCDHPEQLDLPFVQPFDRRTTSLSREAREVFCADGHLDGAHLSDHGYIIINMFFDVDERQPAQEQQQFASMCAQRAAQGYNSGMGEIFRKVAAISPIIPGAAAAASSTKQLPSNESGSGVIEPNRADTNDVMSGVEAKVGSVAATTASASASRVEL